MQQLLAAPSPTLRPLAPRMFCTDCDGAGEIVTHQFADGMIVDQPCRACSGTGMVENPDYDPNGPTWYCRCAEPTVLSVSEGCRCCDADAPESVS